MTGVPRSEPKILLTGRHAANEDKAVLIREFIADDLDHGFLECLDNLVAGTSRLKKTKAYQSMREIQSNQFHSVFVAIIEKEHQYRVVGTTTLLLERKFIFNGGKVGHIEDVSVRKGFEKRGIGRRLVAYVEKIAEETGCVKLVLDCSDENLKFYQKLGYSYQDNCMNKFLKNHRQSLAGIKK